MVCWGITLLPWAGASRRTSIKATQAAVEAGGAEARRSGGFGGRLAWPWRAGVRPAIEFHSRSRPGVPQLEAEAAALRDRLAAAEAAAAEEARRVREAAARAKELENSEQARWGSFTV